MRAKATYLVTGLATLAFAAGLSAASSAAAGPGFISLEGSDATTFHHDASYTPELFSYLQGGSSKSVLVLDVDGSSAPGPTGSVATTVVNSLTGVTLSDYSALYITTPGTCCTADPTALNGFGSEVSAFVAAGGNLSIENYVGGDYDGVVPGGTGPGGVRGSAVSGSYFCSDAETVTAAGIAKGFSQPPVDNCWSHEGYDWANYWKGLGYANLIASDPTVFADGSSFMAIGGSLGAPEPTTWALMILGMGGVGAAMRSRKKLVASV